MEDAVSDMDLKNQHQNILNLFVVSISSYCCIIKSPKQIDMINQSNNFTDVLGDIESFFLGAE